MTKQEFIEKIESTGVLKVEEEANKMIIRGEVHVHDFSMTEDAIIIEKVDDKLKVYNNENLMWDELHDLVTEYTGVPKEERLDIREIE